MEQETNHEIEDVQQEEELRLTKGDFEKINKTFTALEELRKEVEEQKKEYQKLQKNNQDLYTKFVANSKGSSDQFVEETLESIIRRI